MNKKSNPLLKKTFFFGAILLCGFLIFAYGYKLGQSGKSKFNLGPVNVVNTEKGKPQNLDFSLFWEAWEKLKQKSVSELDSGDMINGAISGLLSSTKDPYTVFLTKNENKRFREDIQGEFFGIGVEITQKNNVPTIVAPLSDLPAEEAGLKAGDIIMEVDGAKTSEIGFEETIDKIRGRDGTVVNLKILRDGLDSPIDFNVKRAKIVVKSVEWEEKLQNNRKITYIKIRQFGDDTESLFKDASQAALKNKDKFIIIDLRNNPGGYLETAVQIGSYFIPDGVILTEKGKNDRKKDYVSLGNSVLKDFKVVILVNEGSASASEILAGAMRDRKDAKIVGNKTFGKGSVQELIDLSDGSAVKITVAKWFTPKGQQINGEGIEPDINLSDDDKTEADEQLSRALEMVAD